MVFKRSKRIKTILNLGLLDKHLDNYLEETFIVKDCLEIMQLYLV